MTEKIGKRSLGKTQRYEAVTGLMFEAPTVVRKWNKIESALAYD